MNHIKMGLTALSILLAAGTTTLANANTVDLDEATRMFAAVNAGLPADAGWADILYVRNESIRMQGALKRDLPVDATWAELREVAGYIEGELTDPEDWITYAIAITELRNEVLERILSE